MDLGRRKVLDLGRRKVRHWVQARQSTGNFARVTPCKTGKVSPPPPFTPLYTSARNGGEQIFMPPITPIFVHFKGGVIPYHTSSTMDDFWSNLDEFCWIIE